MTRYLPSKQYQYAGAAALLLALFCACFALHWPLAWVPTGLFLFTGCFLLLLAFMPGIEVYDTHLAIGERLVAWDEIRALDRTGFISPLIVRITLTTDRRILLVYPGGLEASTSLLRHLRRMSRDAVIDGIPYKQFWGEGSAASPERRALASPKYQLLRPEDEAEVERLYQRLKTVGHIDPRSDEK
ncbi:MAG: hypothetical protein SFV51_02650 [Bryobacteraceae bacterium]|nr:hypothetical protein [Bryobacteraceae bacterium]